MCIASFVDKKSLVSYRCIAISEKSVPILNVCAMSGCTSASKIAAFEGKCLYKAPAVIPVIDAMDRIDAFSKPFRKNSIFAFLRISV